MSYFVLLVLNDLDKLEQILSSWEKTGVSGITVMASTGLGRITTRGMLREDFPLIPSLNDLLEEAHEEMLNRTLFSIVEHEETIDRLVSATESVLGSLENPHTGILVAWPLAKVYGSKRTIAKKDVSE